MAAVQPVSFKARDGLTVKGYLTLPPGSDGKRLPMVVMPHGGPFGVYDQWRFEDDSQILAGAGYAVLQVNYRGSGNYGRAFRTAGARQWGGAMQDDLTDATRWAIAQGHADAGRICIYGASYGGYAALMGVAKEPGLYRCAAGYVGVYDLPTMHTHGDIQQRGSGETYLRRWIGERDALAAVSPNRMADKIKVPVFLAAGGEDQRAPIEHSEMMERVEKGRRAGRDAVLPERRPRLLRRGAPQGLLRAAARVPGAPSRPGPARRFATGGVDGRHVTAARERPAAVPAAAWSRVPASTGLARPQRLGCCDSMPWERR
jgi:dipeptidyl aminopeptidase/acylaminoacyl peptidase